MCIEKASAINLEGDLTFVNMKNHSTSKCDFNCDIPRLCQPILYTSKGTDKINILGIRKALSVVSYDRIKIYILTLKILKTNT